MKHLFVSYEIAKQLKEKGFDEFCLATFRTPDVIQYIDEDFPYINSDNTITSAPLYQQVVDWFREKHKIHISIDIYEKWNYNIEDIPFTKSLIIGIECYPENTYYEALNKAIEEAIKLI